jgi:RNA polymerase sigma factor (sigma-70 family)
VNVGFDPRTLEHAAEAACRAALRAGLPEVDARDLAQDALVRALTSARPPAGVALSAWVYGIAKNLGRDHAKSAQRREVPMNAPPDAARDHDLTTVLAVRRAVDELPVPLRDVITLHALEQNSLRETADALQIPFDTAKDRLRRAREQLRTQLGDTELAHERAHTRRRAAAYGAAIVAGVYATLGKQAVASAATGSVAALATGTGARVVPIWIAATTGGALLAAGLVVGRMTAPGHESTRAPVVASAPDAERVEPPDPVVTAAEPAAAAEPATAPTPPGAVTVQARAAANAPAAPAGPTAPASEPATDHGNAEHLLVDRARAGLRRGMHDEALITLMTHAREFPSGAFAEERDVLTIEAYLRAGKAALARRSIDRYRANHPTGVLRARVDALAGELTP